MEIFAYGAAHELTPVAIREKLAAIDLASPGIYGWLPADVLSETLILSTCNRLEIVGVAPRALAARDALRAELASESGLAAPELDRHFHFYLGLEAVRYLFRVTAGLESQVLGEPQILGQVKESFREALKRRAIGPVMGKLLHKSFRAAKRARAETDLALGAVSVASAAVETAESLLGGLSGRRILVIGAGEMAALTMAHLFGRGSKVLTAVNRTFLKAQDLAEKWGAKARPWAELGPALRESDLVFSAAGGTDFILSRDFLAPLAAGRDWWIFDLGVPRNVEEAALSLPGLKVKNIDEIAELVKANRLSRQKEVARVEAIIEEELEKFRLWLEGLAAWPVVKALTALAEEARELEVGKTLAKHDFTPEQSQALEAMSRALVRRILHNPLDFAKSCHRHGRADHNLDMVRRIFGLEPS
jgi:glutamyl-tRNA reductase